MLELTQIELSRQVGMDRRNISKMENGDITVSETATGKSYYYFTTYFDMGKVEQEV